MTSHPEDICMFTFWIACKNTENVACGYLVKSFGLLVVKCKLCESNVIDGRHCKELLHYEKSVGEKFDKSARNVL